MRAHTQTAGLVARHTIITGQDGLHLAGLSRREGYEVHGIIRRSWGTRTERTGHLDLGRRYRAGHGTRAAYGSLTFSVPSRREPQVPASDSVSGGIR